MGSFLSPNLAYSSLVSGRRELRRTKQTDFREKHLRAMFWHIRMIGCHNIWSTFPDLNKLSFP